MLPWLPWGPCTGRAALYLEQVVLCHVLVLTQDLQLFTVLEIIQFFISERLEELELKFYFAMQFDQMLDITTPVRRSSSEDLKKKN